MTLSVALVLSYYVSGSYRPDLPPNTSRWLVTASLSGLRILALAIIPIRADTDGCRIATLARTDTSRQSVYPGALLAHAPLLRGVDQGLEWVVFLLVVTFSTDTGAFFVGKAIGKRPLAPTVSPGKTWEGAIGGFLAAVLAALVAAWALEIDVSVPVIVALGALMGVVGQAGDLFESKLKRLAGVKESGRLLPGHGGVLDRLDSIVFNLALVYYFVIGGAV